MSSPNSNETPVSVSLTGNLLQFNITVLMLGLLSLGILLTCSRADNLAIKYTGTGLSFAGFVALFYFVIRFYSKHKARPLDGQPVSVVMKGQNGQEVTVNNPPDAIFDDGNINALVRQFLVGYDENMCPYGEVIGRASEGKSRAYSEEEKKTFIAEHRIEVESRKAQALRILEAGGNVQLNQKQAADDKMQ